MRAAANNPRVINWASTAEWSNPAMSGYVWQQDGRIIGNVSLIPYFIRSQRYFLIANVAVHPDYRRQGIARRLTEEAITHARQRSAPATWLHVREDNQAAVELYLSLGFVERARRTTWYNKLEYSQPELPLGFALHLAAAQRLAGAVFLAERRITLQSFPGTCRFG